ncbi:MAG: tetratricopeptide repeat protein, partial [Rhodothermales bacterium]|nr:tetratricopeptide repeat protein [Rhodothermales bacterium]
RSCHGTDSRIDACSRPAADSPAEAMTGDCVSCHMSRGGTSDIPHVSFTDHWIRRTIPPGRTPGRIERGAEEEPYVLVDVLERHGQAEPGPEAEEAMEAGLAYFQVYDTMHRNPEYLPNVVALLRRGLAGGVDRADARVVLGRALIEMDSLRAAERALTDAVATYPGDAWAQYWLGAVRIRQGRPAEAVGPLQAAARIQPRLIEAHVKLAEALSATGRAAEAVAALEEAVRRDGLHHPGAWNNLGFLHLQGQRLGAAERALARAVALDPGLAEAGVNLGTVYLLQERLDEAAAAFEQALRAAPDYAPAYGNLGVVYLRQGRRADARRQFERLLELQPGDRQALAYLRQLDAGT